MTSLKFCTLFVTCVVFTGYADTSAPAAVVVATRPTATNASVVVEAPDEAEESLRKSYEELKAENRALKRENRKLRRELVRQRAGEPVVDLSKVRENRGVAGEEKNGVATNDGGFWLTDGSLRRHNSKCRYYKMGRGRPCTKEEGSPCKRCGG